MIKRHKGTWIAMYICALLSLVLLCAASWFIIPLEEHAISNVDAEMDAYKDMLADVSESFETAPLTYSGSAYTLEDIKGDIVADKKTELFGDGVVDISVNWKLGYYSDGTEISQANKDEIGMVAGTHYCEIIDNTTGQVIEPKHEVKIEKAQLTVIPHDSHSKGRIFVSREEALPAWPYTATWKGVGENESYTVTGRFTPKESDFDYNKATSPDYATSYDISPAAVENNLNQNEYKLFQNNYDLSAASAKIQIKYTVMATCYSVTDGKATYYASLNQGLLATVGATSQTTLVAMQSYTIPSGETNAGTYTVNSDFIHKIIGKDKVVGSQVTLVIPYKATNAFDAKGERLVESDRAFADGISTVTKSDAGFYEIVQTSEAINKELVVCRNTVSLNGLLTVNGHVEICGITGYKNPGTMQAFTSGYHATLKMDSGAELKMITAEGTSVSPTLQVYGYIAGSGGAVTVKNGKISMPFVVHDYYGGTDTAGKFQAANISPFTVFDMPNIQAKLTCYGGQNGAKIEALASLFTGAFKKDIAIAGITIYSIDIKSRYNLEELDIFGNEGALINMPDSSGYVRFEYNPSGNPNYAYKENGYVPSAAAVTKMTFAGKTVTGDLTMNISLGLGTLATLAGFSDPMSVSLSSVKFPVSNKFEIHLTGGEGTQKPGYEYKFVSNYKFLPGSKLYIEDGATVKVSPSNTNIGAGLMFYQGISNTSTRYTGNNAWVRGYDATAITQNAMCYIESGGKLIFDSNTSLGGTVTVTGANAILDTRNLSNFSMSEKEGNGSMAIEGTSVKFSLGNENTETRVAQGSVMYANAVGENFVNAEYKSVSNGNGGYAWAYQKAINIEYDLNGGGTITGSKPNLGTPYTNDGYTWADKTVPTATRTYYDFGGWYLDKECTTKPLDGVTLYANTSYKLYAKWTPISYTLKFNYVYDGFSPGEALSTPTDVITFTVESSEVKLPQPTHETYKFTGWFGDADCSDAKRLEYTLTGAKLLELTGGTDTIFGKWTSIQYTVKFSGGDRFGDVTADLTKSYSLADLSVAELPAVNSYRDDITKDHYFVGWYNGDVQVTNISDLEFEMDESGQPKQITLTAKWIPKVSITYTANTGVYQDLITNGDTKLEYGKQYWYEVDTVIKLPNVTANDAATTDGTKNYYFVSWTKDGAEFSSEAGADLTLSANTVINITWAAKHKISATTSQTQATITSYTFSCDSVSGSTLYVKPTDAVTLVVSAKTDQSGTKKAGLTTVAQYYETLTVTAKIGGVVLNGTISNKVNADNSCGWLDYSTKPASFTMTYTVDHTADTTVSLQATGA